MAGVRDVTASPPVRGASRTLDMVFPSPNLQVQGNGQQLSCLDRQGNVIQDAGVNTGFGVPPAGSGYIDYRGRIAYRQTGSGTSGGFYQSGTVFTFPQTKLATAYPDDRACWRVYAICAMDSTGLGSGDTGLEVGSNVPFNINSTLGVSPGFQLAPSSPSQISVRVSQGAGFTINQVVKDLGAGTVDDWHMYEMRFIGATASRDAIFRVLLDGVLLASFSWGAGTLLPNFGNGTNLGYSYSIGNRGATNTWTALAGNGIHAAATEAALL